MNALFLTSSSTTSLLDTSVISYVVDGAKDVIGLMTEGPLGLFISISVASLVVGVAIRIMKAVRR